MSLPVVDCRSLIEFCRAYEQHRSTTNSNRSNQGHSNGKKHGNYLNPLLHPFCDNSTYVAMDVIVLLVVLGALGVLTFPYFKFVFQEFCAFFPEICALIVDVFRNASAPYMISFVAGFSVMIGLWVILSLRSRKCGNPFCKGLRKAVEFDIQLETEQCVKYLPSLPKDIYGLQPLELGEDHKALEAELKKMAPLNGRTVLIFRAPCGCPAGRMEVWGPRKLRRIKKAQCRDTRFKFCDLRLSRHCLLYCWKLVFFSRHDSRPHTGDGKQKT